jgi:hypothetical protein
LSIVLIANISKIAKKESVLEAGSVVKLWLDHSHYCGNVLQAAG